MFVTLYKELAGKNRTSVKQFAEDIGIAEASMRNKLSGKTEFTLREMRKIQQFFGGNLTLDELFADTPPAP